MRIGRIGFRVYGLELRVDDFMFRASENAV